MMNYKSLFGAAALLVASLFAGCERHQGWTLDGHTSFAAYSRAVLMDEEENRLDSVPVRGGAFAMSITDSVGSPRVMTVRLVSDSDFFDMPVVVETGAVKMDISDYLTVGGTRLNDDLQEFLDAMQTCYDRCLEHTGMTADEVERAFSDFYLQQITLHHRDVLGGYIFRNYDVHLSEDARRQAKKLLNIQ